VLRVVPGPRDDWFTAAALETLGSERWRVSASSNRVGIRLEGPPLERVRHDELLSEGLLTGALQVPASGQPILLMQDHPTTGGYPVIAVVRSDDIPVAGQLAPGTHVRFAIGG
jgi:allophanate hydrolase subunit 2